MQYKVEVKKKFGQTEGNWTTFLSSTNRDISIQAAEKASGIPLISKVRVLSKGRIIKNFK